MLPVHQMDLITSDSVACARGRKSVQVPFPSPGFADMAPLTMKSGVSFVAPFSPSAKKICGNRALTFRADRSTGGRQLTPPNKRSSLLKHPVNPAFHTSFLREMCRHSALPHYCSDSPAGGCRSRWRCLWCHRCRPGCSRTGWWGRESR